MKKTLALLGLTLLVSCGQASTQSSDLNQDRRFGTVGVVYSFSADYRPVDGNYVNVTLYSPDGDRFDIVKRTISARGGHKKQQKIAQRIPCRVKFKAPGVIRSIMCLKDERPVDGVKQVVGIVPSRYGKGNAYDVKTRVSFWDRINHKPVTKSATIATKLKRVN